MYYFPLYIYAFLTPKKSFNPSASSLSPLILKENRLKGLIFKPFKPFSRAPEPFSRGPASPKAGIGKTTPAFGKPIGGFVRPKAGLGQRPLLKGLKGLEIKPFSLFPLKISFSRRSAEGLKGFSEIVITYI